MNDMRESEWKLFRKVREAALDRFCEHVLSEISDLLSPARGSHHDRYLAVFKLLENRDRELAEMFDNPRRSTALMQLAQMRSQDLLTDEEFARFGLDTRDWVEKLLRL
jgi:hypothetical protein